MTPANAPLDSTVLEARNYLQIFWRHKWLVAQLGIAGIVAAVVLTLAQPEQWESKIRILVTAGSNLQTEQEVFASAPVASAVAEHVDFRGDPLQLLDDVSVEAVFGTEILEASYRNENPTEAQRRAQLFAAAYLEIRRQQIITSLLEAADQMEERIGALSEQLDEVNAEIASDEEGVSEALQTRANSLGRQIAILERKQVELIPTEDLRFGEVLESASLPTQPATTTPVFGGAIGLVLGLGLGILVALVRDRLGDRIWDPSELEMEAESSVLAVVPRVPALGGKERSPNLVTVSDPTSQAADAYRSLRASFLFGGSDHPMGVILVTSPLVGEGKTTTLANLAVVLAQAGKRVVMVSADLRRPRLHMLFGVPQTPGLSDFLAGRADLAEVVRETGRDFLRLLPSGQLAENGADLLGSDQMGEMLTQLRVASDVVLVDVPPMLPVADAMTVAALSDGVLLVTDGRKVRHKVIEKTRERLERVDARTIGWVWNRASPKSTEYEYGPADYETEPSGVHTSARASARALGRGPTGKAGAAPLWRRILGRRKLARRPRVSTPLRPRPNERSSPAETFPSLKPAAPIPVAEPPPQPQWSTPKPTTSPQPAQAPPAAQPPRHSSLLETPISEHVEVSRIPPPPAPESSGPGDNEGSEERRSVLGGPPANDSEEAGSS